MNSNKKIRVVQWGLGAMGRGMAQLITTKEGLELVGAIDVNPAPVSYTHLTLPTKA